ncbi:MAG: murein L,D-transpeptidase catalytic domain family protein [Pseudomonadota bacterium]
MTLLPLLLALFLTFPSRAAPSCGPDPGSVPDLRLALDTAPTAAVGSSGHPDLDPAAFQAQGLRPEVLSLALRAFQTAWQRGETRKKVLTVIDYSLPSSQKRLWVIDLASNRLLFHEYVAHGSGSGGDVASKFSNRDGTHRSNLGLLKTAETYQGKHGYSLKLDGLEPGWNDNARDRAIVMHAADYVGEATVRSQGRLGRSWGCPALAPEVTRAVIDTIKGGSLIFGYYPDQGWLNGSKYLH